MRGRRDSKKQKVSEDQVHVSGDAEKLQRTNQSGLSQKMPVKRHTASLGKSCGVAHSGVNRKQDVAEHEEGSEGDTPGEQYGGNGFPISMNMEEINDSDWEDGSAHASKYKGSDSEAFINGITVELNPLQDFSHRKIKRRASTEDKEVAELVHKVHLLCLLARGRIIDKACDDPLIQASLLSLVPAQLLKLSEIQKLTGVSLHPLISWFHSHFKVTRLSSEEKFFPSAMAQALEAKHGTLEEIAALSVALFRAMNLTARFVSLLDVVPLKPGVDKGDLPFKGAQGKAKGIFKNPTVMIDSFNPKPVSPAQPSLCSDKNDEDSKKLKSSDATNEINGFQELKRKGDAEYEMQMEMALSATAFEVSEDAVAAKATNDSFPSPKTLGRITTGLLPSSSSQPVATAVGASKIGAPLHWAEVYCSGENSIGKWVHVDAINGLLGGEERVEAAAAACKTSLRYVVAFAGYGAKDVTRRYCRRWYRIAPHRVNTPWWDEVLAPLKELESRATGGSIKLPFTRLHQEMVVESSTKSEFVATGSILEDMELETRAFYEPLPTNQQAYRNHPLYALERWLTKYQVIHPKNPILGFCNGFPVYRRSCVQILKTKEKWMREGLQVRHNEFPAKVLKRIDKSVKEQLHEDDDSEETNSGGTIELFGKWQLEPLSLLHAVNGIVPKNDRGQVDVWSEKCLPHGTVHLKLPRIFALAKKLEIDYAPAMVGFEFRNGRSVPVYDGIVVCSEFKDILLEAYAEEKGRKETEERKRNEREVISRWYQLLSSIITRQRLNNCYGSRQPNSPGKVVTLTSGASNENLSTSQQHVELEQHIAVSVSHSTEEHDHEHMFVTVKKCSLENGSLVTKRCQCGFSVQVEEI
ncbi:hypothetical protein SAY87_007548 [Trapa incisa]|uniref:DNA repair protein RAD4 n=1 Tax=Trapa incisa TaxID=236973 RepID=A0AAN7KKP0_9MYRT|nr:hypothetical protein SAY87_007548 [Trapa incisa]